MRNGKWKMIIGKWFPSWVNDTNLRRGRDHLPDLQTRATIYLANQCSIASACLRDSQHSSIETNRNLAD